jgi:hypothetical protein
MSSNKLTVIIKRLAVVSVAMSTSVGGECILGDAVCRSEFGASSYCMSEERRCFGDADEGSLCTCGELFEVLLPTESPSNETTITSTPTTIPATVPVTTSSPSDLPVPSLFLWTEWPSMSGESAWIQFYTRLREYIAKSPIPITQVFLRILDPRFQSVSLWSVSIDSVLYRHFLSQLPASITSILIYPYLLDVSSQNQWKRTMGTTTALEGVFKYTSSWNKLLDATASFTSSVRFGGIVVDGEESAGYKVDMPSIPAFKAKHNVGTFGYCTGYPQVGVMSTYADYVDEFYFQMYDFYVDGVSPAKLVQNTDVTSSSQFLALLNEKVWSRYLKAYSNPKTRFMWSNQHRTSTACMYPDSPTSCGVKEDFGTQSYQYFLDFLRELNEMYPATFGNKPHGLFQFSFTPKSWFAPEA